MRTPSSTPAALLFAALAAASTLATPAVAAPRGAFLLLMGRDTLALEAVQRSPSGLKGALVFKAAGVRFDYTIVTDPDGVVTRLDSEFRRAADSPRAPAQKSVTLTFAGDSAFADTHDGAVQRLATRRGATPFLNPSMAIAELIARTHRPRVGGSDSTSVLFLAGGMTARALVTRPAADTTCVAFAGITFRFGTDADGNATGGSVPEQGLTIVAVDALAPSVLEVPKPDYSAPADAPYTAESVRVPARGGYALAGTLTLPRNAPAPPACAVMITGSGPEERDESIPGVQGYRPFRQIADALARRGIAVLRCDDRGTGESGGDFGKATTLDFADDVEDALRWLRKRSDVDGSRLALIGHSEGGIIGPLVAVRDPSLSALVVMAGPAYPGRRILQYQYGYDLDRRSVRGAARDSASRAITAQIDSMAAASRWMRFFVGYDPLPTARQVRTPVLILQGEKDWQVTPVQAHELAAAMRSGGNADVTQHDFPATDHLFLHDESGDPAGYANLSVHEIPADVLAVLADWLVEKTALSATTSPGSGARPPRR